jgi:hypothetical protein
MTAHEGDNPMKKFGTLAVLLAVGCSQNEGGEWGFDDDQEASEELIADTDAALDEVADEWESPVAQPSRGVLENERITEDEPFQPFDADLEVEFEEDAPEFEEVTTYSGACSGSGGFYDLLKSRTCGILTVRQEYNTTTQCLRSTATSTLPGGTISAWVSPWYLGIRTLSNSTSVTSFPVNTTTAYTAYGSYTLAGTTWSCSAAL